MFKTIKGSLIWGYWKKWWPGQKEKNLGGLWDQQPKAFILMLIEILHLISYTFIKIGVKLGMHVIISYRESEINSLITTNLMRDIWASKSKIQYNIIKLDLFFSDPFITR